ncbi:MAG TPA: DUF2974 domain-containing protein [Clostridia bacterium]|jgi:hypothetical protein|nr:DUF2974 domain-containing protein [Clostridia bacterium]HQO56311.1 DUF2974 domain-containing protein [Clostridia bacterium]
MDIVAYVERSSGTGFSTRPLNALDALVFSQLVYLPLERIGAGQRAVPIQELPETLNYMELQSQPQFMTRHHLRLMRAAAESRRFGQVTLSHFVDEVDAAAVTQFSAVCASLPHGLTVVAYRGTDLSLAGWQENLRLSYDSPVPAQRRAVDYLRQRAQESANRLALCGHSKGGNLAVYAASFCGAEIQQRITRIFAFDAPGQHEGVLSTLEYQAIRRRIRSFLPERAVVGVLLEQTRPYTVVACRAFGLLQHNPYNWIIEGGAFKKRQSLSAGSLFLDKSLDAWVAAMTRDERQLLTEAIFSVLQSPGGDSFDDLSEDWLGNLRTMQQAADKLPRHVRQAMRRSLQLLLSGAAEVIAEDVRGRASGLVRGLQQRLREFLSEQDAGGQEDELSKHP